MLGEKLYHLRRARGMSQEQLAEKIGVSRQTISKWEGGLSTPDLEKLIALADCFEITLDGLVREDVLPTPEPEKPKMQTHREADDRIQRLTGFVLLLLGAIGLVIAVLLLFVNPDTMESLGGSVNITIDGSGMVYGLCILAMVIGVYLVIRKDQP